MRLLLSLCTLLALSTGVTEAKPATQELPCAKAVAAFSTPRTQRLGKFYASAREAEVAARSQPKRLTEAKAARLVLAKAVARRAGLEWPQGLEDSEAQDLIWAAHTLGRQKRESG